MQRSRKASIHPDHRYIAIGGLLIAIIAAAISLSISPQYSRPVKKLKQEADRFARGELDHRLMPPDSDELAALADAMNQMAWQLDNRIKTPLAAIKGFVETLHQGSFETTGSPRYFPDAGLRFFLMSVPAYF